MVLPLPPAPPELKLIAPYLQRAEETSSADPVISYWCAYYAAQKGITLKAKDSPSRHFLFDLLSLLEKMKSDIGQNDAVHDEPASAAYVENFALRVFFGADDEDRSGKITKNTARKFLAAANFLEILRTFEAEKSGIDIPEIERKIKYAKWKAADIAKAFREGRDPNPGPAASATSSPDENLLPTLPDVIFPDPNVEPHTTLSPNNTTHPSHSQSPPLNITRSPPPHLTDTNNLGPHLPEGLAPQQPPHAPASWRTAPTPGMPHSQQDDILSPSAPSGYNPPAGTRVARMGFVSNEFEGKTEEEIDAEAPSPTLAVKSVHFSPSTIGGFGAPDDSSTDATRQCPSSATPFGPPPGSDEYSLTRSPTIRPPNGPSPIPPSSMPYAHSVPPDTIVTTLPVELPPQAIARAQKHCKFAISALDYEDREQAVKELRAALKLLGG